ncbi:hypothetical protein WJU70_000779 [Enterobacter cloacae]
MVSIYTLTLSPSLDSATLTPQIYPEGKLRCSAPVFEPGGGGINVARAITHLGGKATAIFPAGGATGEHLVSLLADEQVAVETVEAKDWTRQNLHVHVESSGEQYRFVSSLCWQMNRSPWRRSRPKTGHVKICTCTWSPAESNIAL